MGNAHQNPPTVGIAHPTLLNILWLRHASYQESFRSLIYADIIKLLFRLNQWQTIYKMITIVVLINILISLMLLYLAQQLRKITYTFAFIADIFNQYERASYAALHTAPDNIYLGKEKIQSLRLEKQILKQQIQQLRQILSLILLVKQIYEGSFSFPYLKLKNPSKLG